MLVLSGLFGAASGAVGTVASAMGPRLPTGPLIVLAATALFLVSLVAAPGTRALARADAGGGSGGRRPGRTWGPRRPRRCPLRWTATALIVARHRRGGGRGGRLCRELPGPAAHGLAGRTISHSVLPRHRPGLSHHGRSGDRAHVRWRGCLRLPDGGDGAGAEPGGVAEDAAIGVTFTAFFALGVVLLTAVAGRVHLDLDHVLYGEIAYVPWDTSMWCGISLGPRALWTMGAVFLIDLAAVGLFYKEFKICSFDPEMAVRLGIHVAFFHYVLMALVSLTTVAAFESVGAVLAVAMLIAPGGPRTFSPTAWGGCWD